MSPPERDCVLFVEDPGAVNCLAPLAQELLARGARCLLLASGLGVQLLRSRGLQPAQVDEAEQAVAMLKQGAPQWLLVGTSENPDSPAFALVAAARSAHVRSAAVIDFGANSAHRFRGRTDDPLAHVPDYVLVPDEWTAREFVALGLPANRVAVVGHAHHDHLVEVAARLQASGRGAIRERVLPAAARDRTVLVFASEISTGLDPQQYSKSAQYTLHGRGTAQARTEIVVEELLDAVAALESEGVPRPYLVLRRHPKEVPADLAAYRSSFDHVSTGGDALQTVFAADVVIGMSSMLLTEAHLLGTHVISLLPRALERDWLPIVRAGIVACAIERQAFRRLLGEVLRRSGMAGKRSKHPTAAKDAVRSVDRVLSFLEAAAGE